MVDTGTDEGGVVDKDEVVMSAKVAAVRPGYLIIDRPLVFPGVPPPARLPARLAAGRPARPALALCSFGGGRQLRPAARAAGLHTTVGPPAACQSAEPSPSPPARPAGARPPGAAVKTEMGWVGAVHLDWPTIEDAGIEALTVRFK